MTGPRACSAANAASVPPPITRAAALALLEGADVGAVGAAARATFTLPKLKNFGVTVAPTIGTYRFLFGNQR